jgi:RND family efflux transporter MFP subunit
MASRIWSVGGTLIAGLLLAGGAVTFIKYRTFFNPPAVTTGEVFVAPVSEAVYGTGTVEPDRWAKVIPLQRRRLVELCRCEGQAVKAGQILAKQDDAEERSMLQELEIRHEQLDRDLKRARDDRKRNDISKSELEQQESQFEQSQSRIVAQKARLEGLVLRAPLDGMVLRRDGEVGEIVGPTEVLFWVGSPLPKQVIAEINEEEITKIAIGQKAYLRTEAFQGQQLHAAVSQITPKGDPTRKTFRTYLRLPNDSPLRIGMTVEVNIVFREKPSATLVPMEAVVNNAVQVVRDGQIERVPVTVGVRGTRNVEVNGPLSRGNIVLSPGRTDLADGSWVKSGTPTNHAAIAALEAVPDPSPSPSTSPSPLPDRAAATPTASVPRTEPIDPNNATISAAITAHIDSVVSDARKNLYKFSGTP